MSVIEVAVPLVNPNEPEALLAAVFVHQGQRVQKGDLLFALETTKSTQEVVAESDGFVAGLILAAGETVRAGDIFCYLAESLDWVPPESSPATPVEQEMPAGLRITQPALALARQHGVNLAELPAGVFITESIVRAHLQQNLAVPLESTAAPYNPAALLIYGGGGHGKSVLELVRRLGTYQVVGFVDDGLSPGENILGVPILGGSEQLGKYYEQGVRLAVNAVGGIGNIETRLRVFDRLHQAGFTCPAVVHPTAFVEASASISAGVQVFPFAYVGSDVRLGFGVIVNTGAIVSHDCTIGDYANLSPGATLAGGVQIQERVLVGMRATLNLQVQVGAGARIGNGATVKADVPTGGIVPAGSIWPKA
jgi:acetyltransferase EpsM